MKCVDTNLRGWLQDDSVAGHQRGRDLGHSQVHRVVEGGHGKHNAEGYL